MAELTELKGGRDNNTELSSDLPTITAEINAYKRIAGEAIFEIGRRLKGVRDNSKDYGLEGYRDWERWCEEEFGFTRNYANRLIKIVDELGDTYHPELGTNALYIIATMPEDARSQEHTLKSGTTKKPEEMTVKELREIVGKAYTDLGRELKEAQDELRRQGSSDGVFMRWYQSVGFNPKQVSRLIQRFELLTNCQEPEQAIIEDLPVSLTYEIAKPTADATPAKAQAKAEVLSGEITKLKQYKDRIKELEQQAKAERRERERLERELDEVEPEVRYLN